MERRDEKGLAMPYLIYRANWQSSQPSRPAPTMFIGARIAQMTPQRLYRVTSLRSGSTIGFSHKLSLAKSGTRHSHTYHIEGFQYSSKEGIPIHVNASVLLDLVS